MVEIQSNKIAKNLVALCSRTLVLSVQDGTSKVKKVI